VKVRASSTQLAADMAARLGPAAGDRLFPDEPMSAHTTFRVGGPADLLFSPACAEEIACAIHFCREHGVPVTLIGNGSNILVSDRGIRGVVIALGADFARITALDAPVESTSQEIQAEAGARLASLAAFSARLGLSGMEALSGIPGSVGGALHMNAGAYDHSMQEVVVRTEYLDDEARTCTTEGEGHRFGYRRSLFMDRGFIALRTTVRLVRDDPARISERVADFAARRRASQPLELPSAGSVFRRPPGHYAGRLIEESGMKGVALGGAQVSTKHAGFIVNRDGATAADVRGLMEWVQCTVEQRTGVHLEPEILLLGEW
jgi:UDP-N-acetylmuramate dehydrogenase